MRLIVGGASQGKLLFGLKLLGYGETEENPAGKDIIADGGKQDGCPEDVFERPVVYRLHEYIRRFSEEDDGEKAGQHMEQWLKRLMTENPDAVIISNEVGCGIVPVKREDRLWRDLCGRACRILAESASEVYRVSCGIPVRLKGEPEEKRTGETKEEENRKKAEDVRETDRRGGES